MLSANRFPLLLDMSSILIGARFHSHQNAAVVDTSFVLLDALFRDAPVAERANEASRQASGASAGQCYGYGPSNDHTQAGNCQRSAHGGEDRDEHADSSPSGAAKFATLCCLAAEVGFDLTIIGKVSSTGVIGHDHVDVPCVIAALNNGLVCALDTLAVSE
jgi:hypothetical protein